VTVGIMQPYFFPYIGYWQLINAVDKYVVYDDVSFIKGGWISRNRILLNNQAHMLTIPLINPSSFRRINEISITDNENAKKKILRTISAAYSKAPFYSDIYGMIENLILSCTNISELNYKTIVDICELLDIGTEIILSSDLSKDKNLKGQEMVLHINKLFKSDKYINAIGGKALYSKDFFAENGVELCFLERKNIEYSQFGSDFVPDLSIIDVLMFNSIDKVRNLLEEYRLD